MEKEVNETPVGEEYSVLCAAFQTIANWSKNPDNDDVNEAANMFKMDAGTFGDVIMQYFDWETGNNVELKKFLVQLAATLGPDHIENLRRSVAFMQKVDSF